MNVVVPGENTPPENQTVPPIEDTAQLKKELDSAIAQKAHWREKAEKADAALKQKEEELNKITTTSPTAKSTLDVADYIDISASLDGLDPREKAHLAELHTLSKKPLKEIREGEDYQLWQSAYRQKQEKEAALKPTSTQANEDAPKTLTQALRDSSSLTEKEELLKGAGLYRDPRPRADRVNIGNTRTR